MASRSGPRSRRASRGRRKGIRPGWRPTASKYRTDLGGCTCRRLSFGRRPRLAAGWCSSGTGAGMKVEVQRLDDLLRRIDGVRARLQRDGVWTVRTPADLPMKTGDDIPRVTALKSPEVR